MKHCYEHRECKCLPPSTKENKINFEQSTNRTAKQKGRLERNNVSFDQVNFILQLKNLTAAKQKKWDNKWHELCLLFVFLTADVASLNKHAN